ncbi:MAG: glycosyltransferase [Candidatus Nanoarchaeia archaeon]
MKIAFFTDSYLPTFDGVTRAIINFRKGLEELGNEVYIFAPKQIGKNVKKEKRVFYYPGIPFKPYPNYTIPLLPLPPLLKIKKIKPDIVHCHGLALLSLCGLQTSKLFKIPCASTFHTYFPKALHYIPFVNKLKKQMLKSTWLYTKFFLNSSSVAIVPSNFIKEKLKRIGVRKVVVVPNGIDLKKFSKGNGKKIRKRYGIKENEEIVLYLGRIAKEKNINLLVKAFSFLKNKKIKLMICGTGPEEEKLKALAKKLNVNAIFAGFVKESEVADFYSACDVFCIPSSFETQGLVAIEAMAAGKGVLALNSMALREIVNEKNGILFNKNAKELSEKILMALEKKEEYGEGALKTASEYSIEKTTEKLLEIYKKIKLSSKLL